MPVSPTRERGAAGENEANIELDRRQLTELEGGLRLAMLFVLLVAAAVTITVAAAALPLVKTTTEHDAIRFE
ncbi:hypothetical protein Rhe02_69580 [Rhizocola hellebori]|uniref:Uncharacterized protein n=1 Tax=Rhizocola hellebori TaxID=1392758 RepID=A0A8J3VKA8_9ACTN|nr:hypothetical protein [Rhizocola hellebori]GIH08891.1 hypothetical protein Rhe02_69580 [Rhizocola hellebori]